MNKTDAKKISETITNEQLYQMLESARKGIEDWKQTSSINKAMTKGYTWNLLAKDFDVNVRPHPIQRKNLIWEFGDYLPESLKPKKPQRYRYGGVVNHQEPIFMDELPKVGEEIYYAGSFYKVAEIKDFPHGLMIGIYDEHDGEHIDHIKPESVKKVYPCNCCQGGGCPVCSGMGRLVKP